MQAPKVWLMIGVKS